MKKVTGFTTRALHTKHPKPDPYHALHMPVYDGVAFEFDSAEDIEAAFSGKKTAHAYSRSSNPTVEHFECKMKALYGAYKVAAFASGMAAISNTLMSLVENGGNILASNHLFGHSYSLLNKTLPAFGIEVRWVDTRLIEDIASQTDPKTRAIFFETITNPQLEIANIRLISEFAQAHNLAVVLDTTLTPANVFNSKAFGVDVEVMSATKFISGGAAAVGGVVVDNGTFDWSKLPALQTLSERYGKDAFDVKLRKEIFRHLGASMTAHAAHYMNIGLDVMALRVDRCVENCLQLGEFFSQHPAIKRVDYPGMASHPGYQLAQEMFDGKPGAVMTFDLESQAACYTFYNKLKLIRRATNLNDNKTLIIHPRSTIYAELTEEEKNEMGIRPTMLRLSVGIEEVADLIADLEQALS